MLERTIRTLAAAACLLMAAGCREQETGPITVVAIGEPPKVANPNLQPLDTPSEFLLQATAQGLVRFDAAGEIEPALAERWIVSNDGLRYTFRLTRAEWLSGGRVTAQQVATRLRAAGSAASRNPLKPILGAIGEIEAMTDEVLEISLKSPRPNFLQLLAQPEMAVLRRDEGSGPYRAEAGADGTLLLSRPRRGTEGDEEEDAGAADTQVLLAASPPALAVTRFREGEADLVLGGRLGDLPIARASELAAGALVFDPAAGLFGLSFASVEGLLGEAEGRQALSMAIDRGALAAALAIPGFQPRETLMPAGTESLTQAAGPPWAGAPLTDRRALAAGIVRRLSGGERLRLRVALPPGPGYRLLFAHLARDWAAIGVAAEHVSEGEPAELRLMDEVAPVGLASWYLRRFGCDASRICDPAADEMLDAARIAPTADNRRGLLANADRIIADAAPFIPLAAPIRWSLVSPRLTGFRPNRFARHPAGELVRRNP